MNYCHGGYKNSEDEDRMRSLDIADKGTMDLADGFLRLRWREGEAIGPDEAHCALGDIDALGQEASLPMLIHVQGVNFSRAARRIFPSPSCVSRIGLLGSSPVDYVIALFVLRMIPLPFPIRYFTSSQEAITWLHCTRILMRRVTADVLPGRSRLHLLDHYGCLRFPCQRPQLLSHSIQLAAALLEPRFCTIR